MVEYGTVKYFDDRDGKQFGFMFVLDADGMRTEESLFFHFNDGKFVHNSGQGPVLQGRTQIIAGMHCPLATPCSGDKLVFKRKQSAKGEKASPWTYADEWDGHMAQFMSTDQAID